MASWLPQAWSRRAKGRVAGRVLNENGQPIPGACVRLKPGDRTATTGRDGAFSFDELAPRRYVLYASTDDLYAGPSLVRVSDVAERIILRAHAAATIVLHVAADRAPVHRARVVLRQSILVDSYLYELAMDPIETDAQGTVTIRGLAPGHYRGWLTAPDTRWAQEPLSIDCRDRGGTVEQAVTLEPGARVEGLVRGPFDRPVKGATIRLWHSSRMESLYHAESDDNGQWHGVVPAGHYRVMARSDRYRTTGQIELDTDGRTPLRDVVLPVGFPTMEQTLRSWLRVDRFIDRGKRRRIAGVVLDTKGKPIEEAQVHAWPTSGGEPGRGLNAITDSNGRFEFEARDDNEYEVKAGWKDPRDAGHVVTERVRPGTLNVKLVLTSGGTLTGRVLLAGEALRHFGVTVQEQKYSPFGGSPQGIQSADGSFTLDNLDPGTWRVTIMGRGTRRKVIDGVTIVPGQRADLGDVAMERGDRVAGRVRDSSGAAVSGARVLIGRRFADERSELEQWFHGEYATTTNEAGEYVFEGVDTHSPDFATPLIMAKHISAGASLLQELPQGDATIDLVLLGTGSIEGVVEGVQSRHLSVLAKRSEEPPGRRRAFAWGDAFRFEDVPQGDYEVALDLPESEQRQATLVSVVPNESARVTLKFRTSTVQLKVKVKGKRAGNDEHHVELEPAPLDRIIRSSRMSDDLVTYTFHYVKPGNYRLSLDGKKTWREVVVTATPAEQTIEVSEES
jgi:protocatechuate 3,4-dioxygenase beta subunit